MGFPAGFSGGLRVRGSCQALSAWRTGAAEGSGYGEGAKTSGLGFRFVTGA